MTDEELIARLRKAREKRDEFEAVMLSDTAAHRIYNLGLLHDMAEARAEAAEAERDALRAERDEYKRLAAAGELAAQECRIWQGQAEAAEAREERLRGAIRELKRCWYQGDLTENDFRAASPDIDTFVLENSNE